MNAIKVGTLYPVEISVDHDGSGKPKFLAVVQMDGGAPGGFGYTEEEAIEEMRASVQFHREWMASRVPLPEGYPRTVTVEL